MEKDLKVLMISSDRKLLEAGSAVSERMKEYGALVEELHIVLLSDASHGLKETQIGKNVWVYPTNSMTSILRPIDAAKMGKKIVFKKQFVRGKSLITADSLECGWAAVRVKRKWRIPFELQIHNDPFSPYFSGFQNSIRKFFARGILRAADSIRVVSENLKSRILNLKSSANVFVLPIYLDRQRIENAPIKFDTHTRYPWHFILLIVSRLAPEKNIDLAIQALSLVREHFPGTGLLIVGSGPEEKRLKSLVKKMGLEGAVEFAGWQDDLASFYKTANAFIQASFFEGYGLSLVEAGLSGLPIISTPVGIANEFQNGKELFLRELGDVQGFADAIIDLIENNQKRENLVLNMKKALETKLISKEDYMAQIKYNWERTAKYIKA